MATISVTKASVREVQPRMFAITLKLKVEELGVTLFEQDFTQNHKIGSSMSAEKAAGEFAYTAERFKRQMQIAINEHNSEQGILNNKEMITMISTLEGELKWQ